jgi:YD repeat-containing protein
MGDCKSVLTAAAAVALLATSAQAQQKTTYRYDAQGQLVAAKKIEAEATYAYDPASNRTALSYRPFYPVLQSWEAEEMAWHQVGHADGDGWAANASTAAGLLTYGPYATNTPVGDNTAVWKLTRGPSSLAPTQPVVTLSVFDSTQMDTIASRTVTLADWPVASRYEYFTVPFNLPASRKGHYLEFYTHYTPSADVKLDRVGLALPTPLGAAAGVATSSWEAEAGGIGHATGYADADGWAGGTSSASGFLTYGPYVATLAVGERTALWTLMIDSNVGDEGPVVRLEVYDATQGDVITDRTLTRQAWALTLRHQTFGLPFTLDAARVGHALELRTFFWPRAYVRVDKVGVR